MMLPDPLLVTDQHGLSACVEQCLRADAIAVDTEFVRTDTFYPILGLIQISDGETVWLIDPLAITDFGELERLFLDRNVIKVFHSCSEDLEVLRHQLGLVPDPLFDTQIAAAFLGYGYSRGYSALVSSVLDVQLEKHETRSDWINRPLTPSQLSYAAEDVIFLIKVYHQLVTALEQTGRTDWMAEEMADLLAQAREPEAPDCYYLRVKGAWKLSRRDLALLRELTSWREQEARDRNRPRNRVISDASLLELLSVKPKQPNGLHGIEGFHSGLIRRYGEKILDMIHGEPDFEDLETLPDPLDKQGKALLSHCRQKLDSRAVKLGMAEELLARKKDLEPLVRSAVAGKPVLPDRLARGWRHALFGEELLDYVSSRGSEDE